MKTEGRRRKSDGEANTVSSVRRAPSVVRRTRTETDSFGPIEVPEQAYWGAQTERSRHNFAIGEQRIPRPLIAALALAKRAAAETNRALGLLDARRAKAIV
jgi:fumarate hydratase, class II